MPTSKSASAMLAQTSRAATSSCEPKRLSNCSSVYRGLFELLARLGHTHATGVETTVPGIEEDRRVPITAGRWVAHAGARGEIRGVNCLRGVRARRAYGVGDRCLRDPGQAPSEHYSDNQHHNQGAKDGDDSPLGVMSG